MTSHGPLSFFWWGGHGPPPCADALVHSLKLMMCLNIDNLIWHKLTICQHLLCVQCGVIVLICQILNISHKSRQKELRIMKFVKLATKSMFYSMGKCINSPKFRLRKWRVYQLGSTLPLQDSYTPNRYPHPVSDWPLCQCAMAQRPPGDFQKGPLTVDLQFYGKWFHLI